MQAGKLNRRITIQQLTTGQDAAGQPVQTWTDFLVRIPARVLDVSSGQYLAADQTDNLVQTKISIRAHAGVVPAMRVIEGQTPYINTYTIDAVLGQDKRSQLLMCKRHDG